MSPGAIAGDDLRVGQVLRRCRADGRVYPLRVRPPRRRPWQVYGVALQDAKLGEHVEVRRGGFLVVMYPDGHCELGGPIYGFTMQRAEG